MEQVTKFKYIDNTHTLMHSGIPENLARFQNEELLIWTTGQEYK